MLQPTILFAKLVYYIIYHIGRAWCLRDLRTLTVQSYLLACDPGKESHQYLQLKEEMKLCNRSRTMLFLGRPHGLFHRYQESSQLPCNCLQKLKKFYVRLLWRCGQYKLLSAELSWDILSICKNWDNGSTIRPGRRPSNTERFLIIIANLATIGKTGRGESLILKAWEKQQSREWI